MVEQALSKYKNNIIRLYIILYDVINSSCICWENIMLYSIQRTLFLIDYLLLNHYRYGFKRKTIRTIILHGIILKKNCNQSAYLWYEYHIFLNKSFNYQLISINDKCNNITSRF